MQACTFTGTFLKGVAFNWMLDTLPVGRNKKVKQVRPKYIHVHKTPVWQLINILLLCSILLVSWVWKMAAQEQIKDALLILL